MLNLHVAHAQQTKPMPLKPLPLWLALLFFGIPSLLFRVFLYNGIPFLVGSGVSRFAASMICVIIPLALLLTAALVGYRLEGNGFSWQVFKERFRLASFPGRAWLWIVGGIVVSVAGILLLGFTEAWIARIPWLASPYFLAQMQDKGTVNVTTSWANWGIVVILLFQMMFNAMSEELWWRGYILPRQELHYGTRAWVVNGLLWALFHAPVYPWLSIAQLPFYLAVPFVTQRIKNTWTGMIIHFVLLALALIPLALGLLGAHL